MVGLAAIAVAVLLAPAEGVKLRIDKEECLKEQLVVDDVVTGSIVTDHQKGGAIFSSRGVISVVIKGPNGKEIRRTEGQDEQKVQFTALMDGRYEICISNSDRQHVREVSLELHVGHVIAHEKALATHMDDIYESVQRVKQALAEIQSEQAYQKNREARHRVTTETTKGRVIKMAAFEATVIVIVNAVTILGVRKMFENSAR